MSGPSAQLESLFVSALEQHAPGERAAFLERACAGDAALRRRLEALLRAHDEAGQFLETPPWIARTDAGPEARSARDTACPDDATDHSGSFVLNGVALDVLGPAAAPGGLATLGPYEIAGVIGSGGMGTVLQARDPRLGRTVAIKVLAPGLAGNATARQRFLREAQAAAAVRHDHIVTVYAIDEIAGVPALVMEYVDGTSLQDELDEQGPLAVDEIVRIGRQVAAGLHAAHVQGLIHRDIKPDNILLETGTRRVKITDFGLARLVRDTGLTQPGLVTGTPQYMSPEQAHGQPLNPRSDLFSLGCVLYAMCTGHSPFRAETMPAVIRRVCDDQPQPLRDLRPDLPDWLVGIISRLLEKSPDRRFASAAEVQELLQMGADGQRPALATSSRHTRRRVSQARRWVMGAACAAMIAAAAVVMAWRPWTEPPLLDAETAAPVAHATQPHAAERAREAPPAPEPLPADEGPTVPADKSDEETPPPPEAHAWLPGPGEVRELVAEGDLQALTVSADDHTLYAAGHTGVIYSWNLRTGEPLAPIRAHERGVNDLAVARNGSRLVSCSADRTLQVWDVPSRTRHISVQFSVPPLRIACSPDGSLIALAFFGGPQAQRMAETSVGIGVDYGSIVVFDAENGTQVRSCRDTSSHWFGCVAWSPDGRQIAAGTNDGSIILFDAHSGEPLQHLSAYQPGPTYGLQFSPDSRRLYSCGATNLVICWDLADGSRLVERRFMHGMVDLAVNSNETWLAINGTERVRLWDLTHRVGNGGLSELSPHEVWVRRVAFLPDGRHVAACGTEGTVLIESLPLRDGATEPASGESNDGSS